MEIDQTFGCSTYLSDHLSQTHQDRGGLHTHSYERVRVSGLWRIGLVQMTPGAGIQEEGVGGGQRRKTRGGRVVGDIGGGVEEEGVYERKHAADINILHQLFLVLCLKKSF